MDRSDYYRDDPDWDSIPAHMHEGVVEYVMKGVPPGGFLRAVLGNNLVGAVTNADRMNGARLKEWVIFVHNFTPIPCQGSLERVDAWIKARGLLGLREAAEEMHRG